MQKVSIKKIYGVIRTAIYWALAALVIAFVSPLAKIEALRYFIGGLLIFYGVEEIIFTVLENKKHSLFRSLYWNVFETLIGLTLIAFVQTGETDVTYAIVCVSWAIWSILRETREFANLTKAINENKNTVCKIVAIVNLLESLTVIVLSLIMMIQPNEHHAEIHLYLLAAELFTKALFPIVYHNGNPSKGILFPIGTQK